MALKPITVSQFNEYVSRVLMTDPLLMNVAVRGELSGVNYNQSGHVYFTVVDNESKLSCIIWRDKVREIPFELIDGQEVILRGSVNCYKKGGSYSLIVRDAELVGAGELAVRFEKMKAKLSAEGLFDNEHKKDLPFFPKKIAVVTASTGAAIKDIIKTLKAKNDISDLILYPAKVQGEGAAEDIASKIDRINAERDDIDLMIVGRGGGSQEDLWPFNEEIVARSIYASRIPVISAVGHEIDFSISDMVADVRAATPTAAAELAVPDTEELARRLEDIRHAMLKQLKNNAEYQRMRLDNAFGSARDSLKDKLERLKNDVEKMKLILMYNDPLSIMKNGYSIVRDDKGRIVSDSSKLKTGDKVGISFYKGNAGAVIEDTGSED